MSPAEMDALMQAMAPLDRRIRALANRATITNVDDSGTRQVVQVTVLAGERLSKVLRLQPFGFTANPPPGTTGLLISMGGSRTHAVFLEGDHPSRMEGLEPGESAAYNQWGDYVHFKQDGTVKLKARLKLLVDAPDTEFTGNVKINGDQLVLGSSTVQQDLVVDGDGSFGGTGFFTGDLSSASDIFDALRSLQEIVDIYNGHHHGGSPLPDSLMT